MLLTIAIPTYNRNRILERNLRPLLEQLERHAAQCRLLIFDNASPTPVEEMLRPLLAEFAGARVEVRRNAANIGANANIMRCFEECQTPWLWVLGDDDTPEPHALATILEQIAAFPEAMYLNFSFDLQPRSVARRTRGIAQFIESMDSLWGVLSISSSVYRASLLRPNLRVGYRYEYSHGPHLATLLVSLGEDGECRLCEQQIVRRNQPQDEQQWPVLNFALAIGTLLELPMPPASRRRLARKIQDTSYLELLSLQLLLMAVRDRESSRALFLFDQLKSRLFYFERNPRHRAKLALLRLALRFPGPSYALLKRLKGKERAAGHALQDLFERI